MGKGALGRVAKALGQELGFRWGTEGVEEEVGIFCWGVDAGGVYVGGGWCGEHWRPYGCGKEGVWWCGNGETLVWDLRGGVNSKSTFIFV